MHDSVSKMVNYDEAQVGWVYEAIYPENWWTKSCGVVGRSFYLGQTVDVVRRAGQHDRNASPKLAEMLKLAGVKMADVVRLVPELPNGVPALRMNELEGFFIIKRKTLYDPSDPSRHYVCNQNHAAHVVDITPDRYSALEAEVETGVAMELPEYWQRAVAAARAKEAMFVDIKELAEEMDDPEQLEAACTALEVATVERENAESLEPGALGAAKREFAKYEVMVPHAKVERNALAASLNAVVLAAPDDEELGRQVKGLMPAVHSDKFPNQPVPAALAKHVLGVAVEWLGAQAEAAIDVEDTVMTGLRAARDWSA